MKRYWVNELAIIEIDDFNFDYDKPQWKKVYLASEVDAEIARLKKALNYYADEKTWEISENSLSHLNIDFDCGKKAREALEGE